MLSSTNVVIDSTSLGGRGMMGHRSCDWLVHPFYDWLTHLPSEVALEYLFLDSSSEKPSSGDSVRALIASLPVPAGAPDVAGKDLWATASMGAGPDS